MLTRRNSSDPLVRAFLDTYKINLLSVPRENADVGDTYVETREGVSAPGQLRHLLVPDFAMPRVKRDEAMTDIAGKKTRALDLKLGLSLLEKFLSAIGADLAVGKIKAAYDQKGSDKLRFSLKSATRDYVDPFAFGNALIPCRLNRQQPFVAVGNRYYVAVGVVRSPSISVSAEDSDSNRVDVEVNAVENALGVKGALDIARDSNGELTYKGKVPLAFGVELVEMKYDATQQKFLLAALPNPQEIRGGYIEKVFIGDPGEGSIFIL